MKRLAVFLDGTWNDPSSRTNVTRLQEVTPDNGQTQLVHYGAGVGTRFLERFRGGALGKGLARNVRTAYEWLADNYDDGDHIFLFGFSRGAYTARTLGGMIARCGLLQRSAALDVDDIFERYRRGEEVTALHELDFARLTGRAISPEDERFMEQSRRVDIEFIGVWDTVGALGVPFGRIRGLSRSTFAFHNTYPSTLYKNMYHAVAIDEHRNAFDATLWTGFQPANAPFRPLNDDQTLEQRWFVGDHGDVGGSGDLATVPLAWMQSKAADRGLQFTRALVPAPDVELGPHGDSFRSFGFGLYRLARLNRRHRRAIGRPPRETRSRAGHSHVINETIDPSVFRRWNADSSYRPRNLEDWIRRSGTDPSAVSAVVTATL